MDLFLEILDGQLIGTRTPLRAGLTIGRRECDLNLEDPKVSSKHAEIQMRADGQFWIVDMGSANGIRQSENKVKELVLEPGAQFRLGRTRFQVLGGEGDLAAPAEKKRSKGSTWRKAIIALTEKGIKEATPQKKREVFAFHDAIKLSFKRGIQSGEEWTLGYGPREIGASSVDLPLFEPGLPAKCFRITPKDLDAILKVHEEARGKIFLNGRLVETAFMKSGDVLEIGNTRIEISFES